MHASWKHYDKLIKSNEETKWHVESNNKKQQSRYQTTWQQQKLKSTQRKKRCEIRSVVVKKKEVKRVKMQDYCKISAREVICSILTNY